MSSLSNSRPGVRRTRRTVQVVLRVEAGERAWQAESLDLSLSGARLRRPDDFDLAVGQPVLVHLSVGDSLLRIEGRLTRQAADEVALSFQHIGARDSEVIERFIEREGRLVDGIDG